MSIEGIPDGWELVRIGRPMCGEFRVDAIGKPIAVTDNQICAMDCPIIRKIEKPKKYRPFANAAEFEPFRDRWVKYNGDSDCEDNNVARVVEYSDVAASINQDTDTWKDHFDNYVFDDGTPFGIEVTE